MKNAEYGVAYEQGDVEVGRQGDGSDLLGKFNPGLGAQDFARFNSAKFVPKGSDIVFSMHYTATGKPAADRSKLGLVFAKRPPAMRYYTMDGPTGAGAHLPALPALKIAWISEAVSARPYTLGSSIRPARP